MGLKFTERVKLNSGNDLIMTYRARTPEGEDFFAYIKCEEVGVKLMRADYEGGIPRRMQEYGEVIYTDMIKDPDEKAKKFLQDYIAENGGEIM